MYRFDLYLLDAQNNFEYFWMLSFVKSKIRLDIQNETLLNFWASKICLGSYVPILPTVLLYILSLQISRILKVNYLSGKKKSGWQLA